MHKNLTFLTVAAIAIYGILWLLGSEGTAALGLSQEVPDHSPLQGPDVRILFIWFISTAQIGNC